MKKYLKYIMTVILVLIANQSFAYDPTNTFEVARQNLVKTDCSISPQECRYYAAIEYVAFAKACGIAFFYKRKGKESDLEDFDKQVNVLIENWEAIKEPQMHEAVLSKNNPFREQTTNSIIDYLKSSPLDDISIECSRVGAIKENQIPEEVSDLIQATLNYKKWYEPIAIKRQKEFQESQDKILKEMRKKYSKKEQ